MVDITSEEQNKVKRMKRAEDSLRDLWDHIKHTNIWIIEVPNEEKKKGYEKYFEEIIVENFPSMEKEIVNQVQEAHRVPYRINPRRNTSRHILIKLTKTKHKQRILKTAREKQQVTYKGNPVWLTADLSAETLQARREWQDIFKVLKGKNLQARLLYLDLIQTWWRNKKLFRQTKVKSPQYQQTSFTRNVQLSRSVMSDSLWSHGLQHTRPPCLSPTPRVYSNSCPLSQWCHPTISSSVIPFSSHLHSFPALRSFQMSLFFTSGGHSIGVSAIASVLPLKIQDWFLLGWTGWISLQSKGLSGVFSNTTV